MNSNETFIPTAEDFTLQYDEEHKFSFFETEDGEIYSYGHRDPESFVEEIKEYDRITDTGYYNEDDYKATVESVQHAWAVVTSGASSDDEWRFTFSSPNSDGAFPITYVPR